MSVVVLNAVGDVAAGDDAMASVASRRVQLLRML